MKIAMVSIVVGERRSPGGDLLALSCALVADGHEVVIHGAPEGPLAPGVLGRSLGGPFLEEQGPEALNGLGSVLAEDWRKRPPDVVHAHSWLSGLAALAGVRGMRHRPAPDGLAFTSEEPSPPPLVYAFHRPPRPVDRTRRRYEAALARSAALTVAADEDAADEIIKLGVARTRVAVVPSGVDLEQFTPNGPVAPRGDDPRLVAVGDLVPTSGFETAIAALPRLPDAELLLVVKGRPSEEHPEAARLTAGARALGVADRVRFVGSARLPALLRSADVVVHVPWEGTGGAVPLAAMACGVPVVASTVGGATDVVVQGVTGLFVAPRRPDELVAAVRGLLGDPVRAMGFGVAGADRVRSRYTWERAATELARAYRSQLPAEPVQAAEPTGLELAD